MKRKMKCATCGTTKNKATGERLYITGTRWTMMLVDPVTECWDCGNDRREADEKRKQDRREKLLSRFSD